jgi:N-methylhydantoinase B
MNYRLFEVVVAALAQACPQRVVAAGSQAFNLTFGGWDDTRRQPFVYYELLLGCFGGRAGSDGPDGLTSITNTANVPIEITESMVPLRIEQFEYIPDKCGAGMYRGGTPIRRDFRILAEEVTFTNGSDRHSVGPPGLLGGEGGLVAETVLNPGPHEVRLDSKGTYVLRRGDVLSIRPAGSGGYGPPSQRATELVLADIEGGLLSTERALEQYPAQASEGAGR